MNIQKERIAPRLVSKKTIHRLGKVFDMPTVNEPSWKDNLCIFYDNNIKPNLLALIILAIVVIFLTIKYLLKQDKDEREEIKSNRNRRKKEILRRKIIKYKQMMLTNKMKQNELNNKKLLGQPINQHIIQPINQPINQPILQIEPINTNQIGQFDHFNQPNQPNQPNQSNQFDQTSNTKSKAKKKKKLHESFDEDIYYRASDVEPDIDSYDDEKEDRSDDEVSYYRMSKEYEQMIKENNGRLPDGILRDAYEQKKSRTTFDELAKLVGGF